MSIKVTIPLAQSSADLLAGYGAGSKLHIEWSATQSGTYAEVGTGTALVSGTETYEVWDAAGADSTWYRSRVCDSAGTSCSDYSPAFRVGIGGYASLEQFKAYVRDSDTATVDDNLMLLALDAARRAVDRTCARSFRLASGAQTARYYEPVQAQRFGAWSVVLTIDDTFDAALTVNLDDGSGTYPTAVTDFRLMPLNAPSLGLPYTEVILSSGSWSQWPVEVEADWGWDAVPSSVTYATMLQASRFLKRRDAPFGVAGSPDMGNELRLLAKLDPDVAVLLTEFQTWVAVA
jgi:hypothetical protein